MTVLEIYKTYKEDLKQIKQNAASNISQCDKEEQDLLHFLENEKCDAVQMVLIAKKLKEIRIVRRDAKLEHARAISLLHAASKPDDSVQNKIGGTKFIYQTDALNGIAARPKGFTFHVTRTKQNN